jgi:TrmH family RNA methyltransferase
VARVTQITSARNPLLAQLRKLASDGAAYRRLGVVLLEGEHLCAAWQQRAPTPVPQAVVSASAWEIPRLRTLAGTAIDVAVVADAAMAALGTLESPAPIAFLVPTPAAGTLRASAPTVVLDRVQDPGNVGAILRSAAAFGFTQAVALVGTVALWAPKVVRAGMGSHFGLHLVEAAEPTALEALALPLYGTSSHAAQRIDGFALPWPCAWVFGHEGQGIAADVAARCAAVLAIPQPGGEESLNVAAAAAVCLYESARRRGG